MSKKVTIALVGISGYGGTYVNQLLEPHKEGKIEIVGAIDPVPERSNYVDDFKALNIPIFADLNEFSQQHSADLVIMSTPIQFHALHTCQMLEKGSNVLVEKPLCATIQEATMMSEAQSANGKFAAVGYQWSFSDAIQALKKDILSGKFGKAKRLKTISLWPRYRSYYNRNNWAGKLKNANGDWILDSPVNNATAHYLHNMLFVLGEELETSVQPATVQAELYRAKDTENYDTAAIRCMTTNDVEVLFYTSHSAPLQLGPICEYEFENAIIYYSNSFNDFTARMTNGDLIKYGDPNKTGVDNKTWQCIESIANGAKVACDVNAATPHILCMNGAQESSPITDFPKELIGTTTNDNDELIGVNALTPAFIQCFGLGVLPAEHGGIDWAVPGKVIDLLNYKQFPNRS
jgi:predicted dehydrogenase